MLPQEQVCISKQPFILCRIASKPFYVKVRITYKKWTQLPEQTLNHLLCFKDSGEEGTKELLLDLPRENYMANMIRHV